MPNDSSECADRGVSKPCCRKRGGGGGALVEPAALAALLYAGGYGYDLRRIILEMSDGEVDADVGGLYRTLRRMEENGSVISRWHEGETGPNRREYELTTQGVELAEQWIEALRSRERLDGLLANMLESGLTHLGNRDPKAYERIRNENPGKKENNE